jgi:hypothetical protein
VPFRLREGGERSNESNNTLSRLSNSWKKTFNDILRNSWRWRRCVAKEQNGIFAWNHWLLWICHLIRGSNKLCEIWISRWPINYSITGGRRWAVSAPDQTK